MTGRKVSMTPAHSHSCTTCHYLGSFDAVDLYWCPQPGLGTPTLLARYSSAPHDYASWNPTLCGLPTEEPMVTAYALAQRNGLPLRRVRPVSLDGAHHG